MTHAYALARSLARPVARGHLSLSQAHCAMLAGIVRAEREGLLAPYKAADVYRLQQHILGLHLHQMEAHRAVTEMRIKRRVKPLLALHRPPNVVLAEAHDVNGTEGFPFDEDGVNAIAARETYFAGRQRHGR